MQRTSGDNKGRERKQEPNEMVDNSKPNRSWIGITGGRTKQFSQPGKNSSPVRTKVRVKEKTTSAEAGTHRYAYGIGKKGGESMQLSGRWVHRYLHKITNH